MTSMPITELFKEAEKLEQAGNVAGAAQLYKAWVAFNPTDQFLHTAYFNFGVTLSRSGDRVGAINALRECIRLKPDFHPPYINLGRLLEDSGQVGHAITEWLELVKIMSNVSGEALRLKLMLLQQLGRVLEGSNLDGPAEDALRQSLDLKLEQPEVIQHWIALRQRQCRWPVIEGWDSVPAKALMAGISPLSTAVMIDDPMFQLARGYRYGRDSIPIPDIQPPSFAERRRKWSSRKLKIGYVSSDMREHAVGFGLAEVMGLHDRSRFEIHIYYCGISRVDSTQERIRASVDSWTDITKLSDDAAALKIQDDEIDILIDLNGYTRDARTAVFARRPAPVIANWFGFPGSMGTPYHQYIIADPHVIPEGDEIYYSEKVLRLPCYQPNDRKRTVAEQVPSRSDYNLPEGAFVFCDLNGSQKITPGIFQLWMHILGKVPNSVLWLLGATKDTNDRLLAIAKLCGVEPERLIFAQKVPNPQHLARYRLADVFLDTYPYGAHTTAADALWMGVPIVTIPGRTFASKVCAGLVTAAGLPELVCKTPAEYADLAIALGNDPARVAAMRKKLDEGRETSLLFDTPKLVSHLEQLFGVMWDDFIADRLPVPDMANLDVYVQLGTELNLRDDAPTSETEYKTRYQERLRAWNRNYRLPPDSRLWPGKS